MKIDRLWLVGQYKCAVETTDDEYIAWEFQGIFKTESKAKKMCHTLNYFIVPVFVGKEMLDETEKWDGLYYPFAEEQKE